MCAWLPFLGPAARSVASAAQISNTTGQDYYRDAFTLIDLPSDDLVKALPELAGLKPAANQDELPRLLNLVGNSVAEAYKKYTRVVADEQVTHVECNPNGHSKAVSEQYFRYLISATEEAGQALIQELRLGFDGNPIEASGASGLRTTGFASMWTLFFPGNQPESKFRYLGVQQLDGHAANVIGFAQQPGWSSSMGFEHIGPNGEPIVMLYQGLVWCDGATNRILKMRTDLLKPRLDVKLELLTTEIEFGEARFSDTASSSLWVPVRVTVTTAWNGRVHRDEHRYTNHRLPGSTTRIGPVPEITSPPPTSK